MVQVGLGLRSPSVVLFELCTDFYGCHSIMPQVRWFKTTDISSLTFLETRSLKSRCSLAMISLKALEKGLFFLLPFPVSWQSLMFQSLPPSSCGILPVSVSLFFFLQFSSVQLLSHVWLFVTPWTAAHQASLSITNSQSLLKLMSIESVMLSTISSSIIPFFSHIQSFFPHLFLLVGG